MVSAVPVIMFVVAFNQILPVVEVVTPRVPPIVTAPALAVIEIPVLPVAPMLAEVVADVEFMMTSPVVVLAVSELATDTAPPLIVIGPATVTEPAEIETPEVLLVLPIRKLEGGPDRVKLLFVNVLANDAAVDSKTTAPVVLTVKVEAAEMLFPMTVTFPLAVELLVAPRL